MASIEDLEKKRAARKAEHDKARDEQIAADLTAIDELEESRGAPLHVMTTNRFQPGVTVKAAFRAPSAVEYKRYCDMLGRAMQANDPEARRKAQETLAAGVLVYPSDAARVSFLEAFPGVLISLAIEAAKVAELRSEDEGKG